MRKPEVLRMRFLGCSMFGKRETYETFTRAHNHLCDHVEELYRRIDELEKRLESEADDDR